MLKKLNIVIVGAHADDCEIYAGGIALRYLELGHNVTFIVMTDGGAGHHQNSREEIIKRRYNETREVADYLGIEYIIQDNPDGWLEASIENRKKLIRLLRQLKADLIITHNINDYHPDHRNSAVLVADTAYMVNVPLCMPDQEPIGKDVVYCTINFKPSADYNLAVMVPTDGYIDEKLKLIAFHESQVFEWLPWIEKTHIEPLGNDHDEKMSFLRQRYLPEWNKIYENYSFLIKDKIIQNTFKYAEVFELCPWGFQLTSSDIKKYFPFDDAVVFYTLEG